MALSHTRPAPVFTDTHPENPPGTVAISQHHRGLENVPSHIYNNGDDATIGNE